MTGHAYRGACDRLVTFLLTGRNGPCTHCAGLNWEVAPGQQCACGEPLRRMHQPPPEPLEWVLELREEVTSGT